MKEKAIKEKGRIFISYKRNDEKLVTAVAEKLREKNFFVWQDISGKSSGIPYSMNWMKVIEEALFSSHAAIIFRSDKWKASGPCAAEFKIISSNKMKYYDIIPENGCDFPSADEIVSGFCEWYEKNCADLDMYRWAMSGAYRLRRDKSTLGLLPRKKGFFDSIILALDIGATKKQLSSLGVDKSNPEIFSYAKKYMRRSICGLILPFLFRAGIAVTGVLAAFLIYVGIKAVPLIINRMDPYNKGMATVGIINEVKAYDPIEAGSLLTLDNMYNEFTECPISILYSELLSYAYPSDFFKADSDEAKHLTGLEQLRETDSFRVDTPDSTARIFVTQKKTDSSTPYLLNAPLSARAFSADGSLLVLAAGENVWVISTGHSRQPVKLRCNNEPVIDVGFDGDKIYAVNECGSVIVWDVPIMKPQSDRASLCGGTVFTSASGASSAVYTDGESFFINIGGKETAVDYGKSGRFRADSTAVDADGKLAAAVFAPSTGEDDHLVIFDIASGTLKQDIVSDTTLLRCAFNGSLLAASDVGNNCLLIVDTTSGSTSRTAKLDSIPIEPVTADGTLYSVDSTGGLTRFTNTDRPEKLIDGHGTSPNKRSALCTKYNLFFRSGRGGNVSVFDDFTNYSTGEGGIFIPSDTAYKSDSAIAVSDSGEYVAAGQPDGEIIVWTTKNAPDITMAFISRKIPEPLVDIGFSSDEQSLICLGLSGTVYDLPTDDFLAPKNYKSRQFRTAKTYEIYERLYKLGLTYVVPDRYYQKINSSS